MNTSNTSGDLSARAMLTSLSVSMWTARKLDRKVTREVNASHGAAADAGRYNKHLLPGDARSYAAIVTAANAARAVHYENTLPWMDDGARILPAANFMTYAAAVTAARGAFETAVAEFVAEYPYLRDNARIRLNGLYNPADYPAPRDVADRFAFRTTTMPLPAAADFRVQLADADAAMVRQQIEEATMAAVNTAMREAWGRLKDALQRMATNLGTPGTRIYETMFTNLAELCEILPRLNIAGDPALDRAAAEIRERVLARCTPQDARDNPETRAETAREVERIMAAMQGLF